MNPILALAGVVGVIAVALPLQAVDPQKFPARPELPDPLVMLDGTKISTPQEWATKRKPELKELFQEYMYGRLPSVKANVSGKVIHEDAHLFNGLGTLREIELNLGIPNAPPIYLLFVTPNQRARPVGVFIGLNFAGNHTIISDPKIRLPQQWMYPNRIGVKNNRATDEGRGSYPNVWPLKQILEAGYALATVCNGDIIPDHATIRGGLRDVLMPLTEGQAKPNATATIMAWSWGLSRIADYVEKQPEIDPKKMIVIGHSRLGKTALVAAAFDERFAMSMPHQAGCGGTGPSRSASSPKAETVERINKSFPHWFCDNFKAFGADPTRLPFDQNGLVALCAPRPVLFTNATDDLWANPTGQFDVL